MDIYDHIQLFCDKIGVPTPVTEKARNKVIERMVTIGFITQDEADKLLKEDEVRINEIGFNNRYTFWRTK